MVVCSGVGGSFFLRCVALLEEDARGAQQRLGCWLMFGDVGMALKDDSSRVSNTFHHCRLLCGSFSARRRRDRQWWFLFVGLHRHT